VHAKPVFVDPSGRRGRLLRRGGLAAGIALAGFLGIVGFSIVGGAATPLTPWISAPSHAAEQPAASHRPTRTPSPTAGRTASHTRPSSPAVKRTSSSTTSPAATSAVSTASTHGHGNATRTPPGLAKKTKSP